MYHFSPHVVKHNDNVQAFSWSIITIWWKLALSPAAKTNGDLLIYNRHQTWMC